MADPKTRNTTLPGAPRLKRGFGVLIMLIAVPVVWTALLAPMMDLSAEAVVVAVALAGLAGLVAGLAHRLYVDRVQSRSRTADMAGGSSR